MIAYTLYSTDARVRREAETLVFLPGYKVFALVLKEKTLPRTYLLDGVEVHELNVAKYRGKSNLKYLMSYLRFLLMSFIACSRLLFRKSIDVVHIHNMPNFLVFAAIIPLISGKKIILDVHDTLIETYASKFGGVANKIMTTLLRLEEFVSCKLAHKIICVNRIQRDALVKRGIPQGKITISMNVPDPKRFSDNGNVIRHRSVKKFRMAYFGTISKRLGIDLAIRAVANLNGRAQGLEFHILGDGEDKEEFINLCRELKVEELVLFHKDFLPLDELIKFLETVDLGLIPNRKNAATELMLPVKLLECVALGIPVIAPRLKTIENYFSSDMVFYFEPDQMDSLTDTILDAFNRESKRINKAENAKRFLKEYGWETHKYELINLYKSLA